LTIRGEEGTQQRTPIASFDKATKEFCTIFKQKTKNTWGSEFEIHDGCYSTIVEKKSKPTKFLQKLESKTSTVLPKETFELIKYMTDVSLMNESMKEYGINSETFGEEPKLKDAISLLRKIHELIKIMNNEENSAKERKEALLSLVTQCNNFYSMIPHIQSKFSLGLMKTESEVIQKIKLLELMSNLEISSRILLAASYQKKINPVDYCYYSLYNILQRIDYQSSEFQILRKYATRTSSRDILDIFTLNRKGEIERFKKHENKSNQVLLWHGSRTSNLMGILSSGLKVAPPEAPTCGYMFGKGIYFADKFSKSSNYCHGGGEYSFMLLCQVALGEMSEHKHGIYLETAEPGSDSTKGVGKSGPNFSESFVTNDGIHIPCGPIHVEEIEEDDFQLQSNEYIVYDESQVKLKYLLIFK
jgi:hypothetical protein